MEVTRCRNEEFADGLARESDGIYEHVIKHRSYAMGAIPTWLVICWNDKDEVVC